jgi:hypothetical protein
MDDDQLNRLRERYMYKFILPNDEEKVTRLKVIFGESTEIRTKLSANGNYISITIFEMMLEADHIFDRYRMAGQIEGIISL